MYTFSKIPPDRFPARFLYRAWLINEERMVYSTGERGDAVVKHELEARWKEIYNGDIILMGCTASISKGRFIYESDIITIPKTPVSENGLGIVVWSSESKCWMVEQQLGYDQHLYIAMIYKPSIVGNIYQNPDLLLT